MARGGGGRGGFGGGGGSNWVGEALTALDSQMFANFQRYADTLLGTWTNFQGNHGQMTVVANNIYPQVVEHIHAAGNRWPYAENPENYLERMNSAYDPDVIFRAFSQTINDSYEAVQEYWLESMTLQAEHESIAAIIGAVHEPHSTSVDWPV